MKAAQDFRLSVHQRLGPPVNQEGKQSFRNGRQNWNFVSNRNSQAGVSSARDPNRWGEKPFTPEKAGPPKGSSCQWRDTGRGSPSRVYHCLLGECRSSRILRSGVLLEWDLLSPLTRTPKQFPTKNKTEDLQKAVDSLLKNGAIISLSSGATPWTSSAGSFLLQRRQEICVWC